MNQIQSKKIIQKRNLCAITKEPLADQTTLFFFLEKDNLPFTPTMRGTFINNTLEEYDRIENAEILDDLTKRSYIIYDEIIDNPEEWKSIFKQVFVSREGYYKNFSSTIETQEEFARIKNNIPIFRNIQNLTIHKLNLDLYLFNRLYPKWVENLIKIEENLKSNLEE